MRSFDAAPARLALHRARRATRLIFFVAGMLYASWGVHIATVRDTFRLSPGMLSLPLLAAAAGSVLAMLTNGPLIDRLGTRRACTIGGALMLICSPLIVLAPTLSWLIADLLLFGFGLATLDVAMNAEASLIERGMARPLMSSMHGMFSAGGMAGAMLGALFVACGITPLVHLLAVSASGIAALAIAPGYFLPVPAPGARAAHGATSAARWRSAILWGLGALALVALIAEGAMYDWTTVYMRDVVLSSPAVSAAAYATFTGGMTVGRFCGDAARARIGAAWLMLASGVAACAGIVLVLLLPAPLPALLGFSLLGLGLANMMPVLFTAASNVRGVSAAEGLAHVAGLAYFGVLIGPVLIGGVAQMTSLREGIGCVAIATLAIAAAAPWLMVRLRIR